MVTIRSKGERAVHRALREYAVTVHTETKFKSCIGDKKQLPFDFSIYDEENNLIALIEYDGVQHYIPTYSMEDWDRVKRTDKIKTDYCINNKITLLRIPYFKYSDIKNIISVFMKSKGIKKIKSVQNRR